MQQQQQRILIILWSGDAAAVAHLCKTVGVVMQQQQQRILTMLWSWMRWCYKQCILFNVVKLDAAAAMHPHNVGLGGNSAAV